MSPALPETPPPNTQGTCFSISLIRVTGYIPFAEGYCETGRKSGGRDAKLTVVFVCFNTRVLSTKTDTSETHGRLNYNSAQQVPFASHPNSKLPCWPVRQILDLAPSQVSSLTSCHSSLHCYSPNPLACFLNVSSKMSISFPRQGFVHAVPSLCPEMSGYLCRSLVTESRAVSQVPTMAETLFLLFSGCQHLA